MALLEKTSFKMDNIIKVKFVEVPYFLDSLQDKIGYLNRWMGDMQRNGINIISVSNIQRQELPDGSFTEGFTIEFREMN